MTVSVVEVTQGSIVANAASATAAIAATPAAGDVVVLCVKFGGTARVISSVTGITGTTWASGESYGTKVKYWIGTGASAAGTATVNVTGGNATNWNVTAYLIRGLSSTVAAAIGLNSTGAGAILAPRFVGASSGQIVLSGVASTTTITAFPDSPTPSSGWTSVGVVSSFVSDAYIVPTGTSEGFGAGIDPAGSGTMEVLTIVLGTPASPSVRNVIQGAAVTSTGPAVTTVQTPEAGDVYVLAIKRMTAAAVTVNSVSGGGATWAALYSGGTAIKYWIGTGTLTAGTITATLATNGDSQVTCYTITGLSANTVAGATATATGTSLSGPSQSPGKGQLSINAFVAQSTTTPTYPSAQVPSTGWTKGVLQTITARNANDAWRAPEGGATAHSTDITGTASVAMEITSIILGDLAATGSSQVEFGAPIR